jgi:hypothetical protein
MGSIMIKILLIFFIAASGFAFFIFMNIINNINLIAIDPVPVYSYQEEAMKNPAPNPRLYLMPGQQVEVAKCIDVKHYQIYKIKSPDGKPGFILDGNYRLEHNGKPSAC